MFFRLVMKSSCGVLTNICKSELQKGLKFLRSGLNILSFQPEGSFESQIGNSSKQSLIDLEKFVGGGYQKLLSFIKILFKTIRLFCLKNIVYFSLYTFTVLLICPPILRDGPRVPIFLKLQLHAPILSTWYVIS